MSRTQSVTNYSTANINSSVENCSGNLQRFHLMRAFLNRTNDLNSTYIEISDEERTSFSDYQICIFNAYMQWTKSDKWKAFKLLHGSVDSASNLWNSMKPQSLSEERLDSENCELFRSLPWLLMHFKLVSITFDVEDMNKMTEDSLLIYKNVSESLWKVLHDEIRPVVKKMMIKSFKSFPVSSIYNRHRMMNMKQSTTGHGSIWSKLFERLTLELMPPIPVNLSER